MFVNNGFSAQEIAQYKEEMNALGKSFLYDDDDYRDEEYAHFFFIGHHQGKEVIYDTVLYTLSMEYETQLLEVAEEKTKIHFPEYAKLNYDEEGTGPITQEQEDKISLFMAEVIAELEEEGTIKVKEHIDKDDTVSFGIALDVALHRKEITENVIEKFIKEFNAGTLVLDPTLYTFQMKGYE